MRLKVMQLKGKDNKKYFRKLMIKKTKKSLKNLLHQRNQKIKRKNFNSRLPNKQNQ